MSYMGKKFRVPSVTGSGAVATEVTMNNMADQ